MRLSKEWKRICILIIFSFLFLISREIYWGWIWDITPIELLRDLLLATLVAIGVWLLFKREWIKNKWNKFYEKYFIARYPPHPLALFVAPTAIFPLHPKKLWKMQISRRRKLMIVLATVSIPTFGFIIALIVVFSIIIFSSEFITYKWPPDVGMFLILAISVYLGGLIVYQFFKLEYKVVDALARKYTGKSIEQL